MRLLQSLKARLDGSWSVVSLRTYLMGTVLLAMVPIAAVTVFQVFMHVRTEQAAIEKGLVHSAAILSRTVEHELNSSLDALGALSRSGPIQQGQWDQLAPVLQSHRDWDGVFVLDPKGKLLMDTASLSTGPGEPDASLLELHQRVMHDMKPGVSGLSDSGPSG